MADFKFFMIMRKFLLLAVFGFFGWAAGWSQEVMPVDSALMIIAEKGYLEQVYVVKVDGADAGTLFRRAMEHFSSSNVDGIEYEDKEEGVILFNNRVMTGSVKKTDVYANYQMRVRCKDGRAQLTVKIPNLVSVNPVTGSRVIPLTRYLDRKTMEKAEKQKDKSTGLSVREIPAVLLRALANKMAGAGEDDDF